MLAKIGHKVKDLTRVKMGPLTIEGLAPGQSRELTPREVKALQKVARDEPPTDDTPANRRASRSEQESA
jgi:23S rRNA pseudouridine2605 synthase